MKENNMDRDRLGSLALESALAEYGSRYFRFAYGLCGSREDAEDIVEEAFLAAWRNRHKIRDRDALVNWLYRIVLNQFRMHRRRRQVPTQSITEVNELSAHFSTDYIALAQAMELLTPKQREALTLVKGEGLTLHEAAKLLRRPVGTVASHVAQAMTQVRRELFPDYRAAELEPVSRVRWNHELP